MDHYLSELKCHPKSTHFKLAILGCATIVGARVSPFSTVPAVILAGNPNILPVSMSKLIQTFVILIIMLT